ncbi:MAG: radical SAM family heme chaperone HemW [Alphaproteobacteria bacterium]|nr:radical SAM family heme chaperone HemW [Alphaproteobacteria bacterium]
MNTVSIYFHWPYCKSKCPYCDFFKKVDPHVDQASVIETYLQKLKDYHELMPDRVVRSVFFGGGTPSLIEPRYIEVLLGLISKLWHTEKNMEISLEANPNTDRSDLFTDLKNAGINRLSLGVQALNDADLKFLGRTHSLKDALSSIENVLHTFDNHSIDLIYARPNQHLNTWFEELKQAVSFGLKHLSLYQLTIEEGTLFFKRGIKALEEDAAANMYLETVNYLKQHGYPRYEVSNFAKEQYESVHNKCYWQGDDYIGIGESAHGRIKIGNKHYALVDNQPKEELSVYERAEELILLGLRLQKGIDKNHFEKITHLKLNDVINQMNLQNLKQAGFIEDDNHFLRVTDKGFLIIDRLALELLS